MVWDINHQEDGMKRIQAEPFFLSLKGGCE
jgi:hypothetical protein